MSAVQSTRPVSRLDHLVVVADTLSVGVAWCEAVLGVLPGPGGQHASMGTHNRLLRIGAPAWPQAYLEIIAIDLDAAPPAAGRARWFGMDDPTLRAAVRRQPQLVHFVAQTSDLEAACAALARQGQDVGRPVDASRRAPQGELRWRITLRDDGVPQLGGALPALIDCQADGEPPNADGRDHFARRLLAQKAAAMTANGALYFNDKLGEVARRGPQTSGRLLGIDVPGRAHAAPLLIMRQRRIGGDRRR